MANIQLTTIKFESGERLPILVHADSGLPCKLSLRWAMSTGRYDLASSSLENYLRSIKLFYKWAEIQRLDLDEFLVAGYYLDHNQLRSLCMFLREKSVSQSANIIVNNTYNRHIYVAEAFFSWLLDPNNRGGIRRIPDKEIAIIHHKYKLFFASQKLTNSQPRRIPPISIDEENLIRAYLAPRIDQNGKVIWPDNGCRQSSRLRNYLMFEFAIRYGLRRGEILKLRIDSIPRGNKENIKIQRFPDDPADSRINEPAVKSSEREVLMSDYLRKWINLYLTRNPPLGRRGCPTPYLFVTRAGEPISISQANSIIARIGEACGIADLSWHRFRHTWAERLADILLEVENGLDQLRYLGGWKRAESAEPYIRYATEKIAQSTLQEYQKKLYGDE